MYAQGDREGWWDGWWEKGTWGKGRERERDGEGEREEEKKGERKQVRELWSPSLRRTPVLSD